jgi:caa(3)-type oxidase subunit IV
MGEWHIVVGTAIGVTKVAVVALFFMHLVRSPARTWLAAAVGLYWLHILIALMMTDYFARRSAAF